VPPLKKCIILKKKTLPPKRSSLPPSQVPVVVDYDSPAPHLQGVGLTHPYAAEFDFADWAFEPHTLTVLSVAVVAVVALYLGTGDIDNAHYGTAVAASVGVFLAFCTTHLPDGGVMVRPHPAVWRFLLGVAILYLMLVVFLLFISLEDARKFFAMIDPSLANPLPERSYAEDCRIATAEEPYKFFTTVYDEFIIAHALGYWVKTLILRDPWLVLAVSVGFELVEFSFQHWLPNFKECWWDHLLIDIAICNAGGMVMGMATLRWLGARQYSWVRLKNIQSVRGKARRIALQLTPRNWLPYNWAFFHSPVTVFQVVLVLLVMLIQELNVFTSKYVLYMRPTHPLVISRVAMWGFLGLPAIREFYVYTHDRPRAGQGHRFGTTVWVCSLALIFETLTITKYAKQGGFYRMPWPPHIYVPWALTAVIWLLWLIVRFGSGPPARLPTFRKYVARTLFVIPFFVLLAMCCMAAPDLRWYQKEFDSLFPSLG